MNRAYGSKPGARTRRQGSPTDAFNPNSRGRASPSGIAPILRTVERPKATLRSSQGLNAHPAALLVQRKSAIYFRNWCYSLPTPLADMQDGPYLSFAVLLRAGVHDGPAEFIARFAWGRLSSKADIRESGHRRRICGDAIGAAPSPCASRALSRQRAASSIAPAMPSPSSWLVGLPARMRPGILAAIGSTTDRVTTHDLELDLGDADEPKGIGVVAPRPSWSLG